ncbi:MAG: hypothetical protein M0Z66_16745, partial [Thermaerobacter sp.]|nr:hypothetical protein [Thermaerobacter sp.]
MEEQFKALVVRAREAAAAYYNGSDLLMTDAEYDVLIEQIATAKAEHPDWDDQGVLERVAAGAATGDVQHSSMMLSLAKVKTEADLLAFIRSIPAPQDIN